MELKAFNSGAVVFRKGEPGECMYCIQSGSCGVFEDYGTPKEKQIARLATGDYFGEMSLLDRAPRSATIVALEDTSLQVISEDSFSAFLASSPDTVLELIRQMSDRLRRATKDYVDACRTVYETVEAKKNGQSRSEGLLTRIKKFCGIHQSARDRA